MHHPKQQTATLSTACVDGKLSELVLELSLDCLCKQSSESYKELIKQQDRAVQGADTQYQISTLQSQLKADMRMMQLRVGLVSRKMHAVTLDRVWYLAVPEDYAHRLPQYLQAMPNIEYCMLEVDKMSIEQLNSAARAVSESIIGHIELGGSPQVSEEVTAALGNWDVYGVVAENYFVYSDPCNKNRFRWIPWDNGRTLTTSLLSTDVMWSSVKAADFPLTAFLLQVHFTITVAPLHSGHLSQALRYICL